jgi:hypothetical protein
MDNKYKCLIIFILIGVICQGQILPTERMTNWSNAGAEETRLDPVTVNIMDYGADSNGIQFCDNAMNEALSALIGEDAIIYIPSGTFLFSSRIDLPSNISIIGAGAEKTKLFFDLQNNDHLIYIQGNLSEDTFYIEGNIKRGDTEIIVDNAEGLSTNDCLYLIADDDHLISSGWAWHTTGQLVEIASIEGNRILLKSEIRRDYEGVFLPRIISIFPAKNIGIEKLSIQRKEDLRPDHKANIYIYGAKNCRVLNIESICGDFAHIDIRMSSNISVQCSYFHDALRYGSNGEGYGIMIHSASGECLIENNIFKHLRHSMILQSGANGNVFAYNYSSEPYWTGVFLPSDAAGDIVLHGNYPYCNLFEGNICQNINIDGSHGINGPYNTFFRNRAELYGICMSNVPPSNKQNFIGNEVPNQENTKGNYSLFGEEHFEFANRVKGMIFPAGTDMLDDKSYYCSHIPSFYAYVAAWPPIGIPNKNKEYINEAQERFQKNETSLCGKDYSPKLSAEVNENTAANSLLFPNPCYNKIYVKPFQTHHADWAVISGTDGKNTKIHITDNCIDMSHFSKGFFIVSLYNSQGQSSSHKIIKAD